MGKTSQLDWSWASQLDLQPIPQEGVHMWYRKPGQKPVAGEVMGSQWESNVYGFSRWVRWACGNTCAKTAL